MGPFGTMVILPMFPELRESFDASSEAVGYGFTAYLMPFALLLVVSGTLGERWGRRRTVRVTFIVYALASLLAALAPGLGMFLVARGLQGAANAFITPLLLAGLADMTPPERLGGAVGIYSSFQSFGTALAPLVGGIAADTEWRWAFGGTAIVALMLAMFPPPGEPRSDLESPPIQPLLSRRMILLGVAAFTAAAGPVGAGVLVGVAARDEFDLSGSSAGVLLLVGSLVATVLGPLLGRLVDVWGPGRAGQVSLSLSTVITLGLAAAGSTLALGGSWALGAAAAAFVVVVLQATAAAAVPDNRGGAVSTMLAWRFFGHAVGPAVWIPVFEVNPDMAFIGSAALGVVAIAAISGANRPRGAVTDVG